MTDFKMPTTAKVATADKKFQHYAYSKQSTQMITPTGKKFSFVASKLITDDEEIIEYLDTEIKNGLNTITKGALLSAKESDPMRKIKAQAVEDYKKEQAELAKNDALGIKADMGSTDTGKSKPFSPVSTTDLTNAAGSASGVSMPPAGK